MVALVDISFLLVYFQVASTRKSEIGALNVFDTAYDQQTRNLIDKLNTRLPKRPRIMEPSTSDNDDEDRLYDAIGDEEPVGPDVAFFKNVS